MKQMRKAALDILVFLAFMTATTISSQAGSPPCQSSVTAVVHRDTICVYHNQAAWGCDEGVRFELHQIGATFILREFVVPPKDVPLPCLCCYDFKTVIAGVPPGIYLVRVFHADTDFLIGEVWVTVESFTGWGQAFLKQTVMSPCGGFDDIVDVAPFTWGHIKAMFR